MVRHWDRQQREVVKSLSLEVLKNHGDMALRDMGMVAMGWWLDLMILEVFSNLNDSMNTVKDWNINSNKDLERACETGDLILIVAWAARCSDHEKGKRVNAGITWTVGNL